MVVYFPKVEGNTRKKVDRFPFFLLTALKAKKKAQIRQNLTLLRKECVITHILLQMNRYILFNKYIDSFGEKGDIFFNLQNLHFSNLFWGLSYDLFVKIFKPEGVVFHRD